MRLEQCTSAGILKMQGQPGQCLVLTRQDLHIGESTCIVEFRKICEGKV